MIKRKELKEIAKLFIKRFMENEIDSRANAVAFNFTLSLFPATIFFFTLLPYFPYPNLDTDILSLLENSLPESTVLSVKETILDILNRQHSGLVSFVFLSAFFLSTNGMTSLMNAFNHINHHKEKRSYWYLRLVAVILVIVSSFGLIACVIILILGNNLLEMTQNLEWVDGDYNFFFIDSLRFITIVLLFLLTTSLVYKYAPSTPKNWRLFSAGSVLATILIILSSMLLSWYIDVFGTYNVLYGSIGTMLGFMFWMFLIALSFLVGYQLNVVLIEIDEKRRSVVSSPNS